MYFCTSEYHYFFKVLKLWQSLFHGKGNVIGTVVEDLGITITEKEKIAEKSRLKAHYDKKGKVLKGNEKSFKPKINCG